MCFPNEADLELFPDDLRESSSWEPTSTPPSLSLAAIPAEEAGSPALLHLVRSATPGCEEYDEPQHDHVDPSLHLMMDHRVGDMV